MRIAPRSRFSVLPIGLNLDGFLAVEPQDGAAFRREAGAGPPTCSALFVGRLAPIKRVDVLLEAVAVARGEGAPLRLAIVGDGELRVQLEAQANALGVSELVTFCGFRSDLPGIVAGADVAVLSSDNEGTPVALIEAAAAARPAVSTRVGGVSDIVRDDTGLLGARGQRRRSASALARPAADRRCAPVMRGGRGRHVRRMYDAARLVRDIDDLYVALLAKRKG